MLDQSDLASPSGVVEGSFAGVRDSVPLKKEAETSVATAQGRKIDLIGFTGSAYRAYIG